MKPVNFFCFFLVSLLAAFFAAGLGVYMANQLPYPYLSHQVTAMLQAEQALLLDGFAKDGVVFWANFGRNVIGSAKIVLPCAFIFVAVYYIEGYFMAKRATAHRVPLIFTAILGALFLQFVGITSPLMNGFDPGFLGYTELEMVVFIALFGIACIAYPVMYHWVRASRTAVVTPAVAA